MERAAISLAAIVGMTLTGCASDTDGGSAGVTRPTPRCFSVGNARNFRVINSSTVHLRVGRSVYRLDMLGSCPDLSWSPRMALVSRGSSRVCEGPALGLTIISRGSGGDRRRCPVRSITALTPEQVQALPARDIP